MWREHENKTLSISTSIFMLWCLVCGDIKMHQSWQMHYFYQFNVTQKGWPLYVSYSGGCRRLRNKTRSICGSAHMLEHPLKFGDYSHRQILISLRACVVSEIPEIVNVVCGVIHILILIIMVVVMFVFHSFVCSDMFTFVAVGACSKVNHGKSYVETPLRSEVLYC